MSVSNADKRPELQAIIDRIPEPDRATAMEKVVEADRKLRRQDRALADALVRILKSPIGKELRSKIKEKSYSLWPSSNN